SEASIKRGKEMFEAIECHKCHGTDGRGDGPSRAELKDEWGNPIAPANLTKRWTFRGGASRTEIATRLANGVLGTPMPAFLDSVEKPEDIWHLTNFIQSLGPDSPHYGTGAPVLPDGRRLRRRLPAALGERQGRERGERERPGQDRGDRRRRSARQSGVHQRPVPARDHAPARVEGCDAPDVHARGVRARRVPGVGRRRGGDRDQDVRDLVVLSAAGGAAVEPPFRHSSRRG